MNDKAKTTDIATLLGELNGGQTEQMINRCLSDVAANVLTHGKKGRVAIVFDLSQIGESNQVNLEHTIIYTLPTKRGKRSEDYKTDTPVFVGAGGIMTMTPAEQIPMFPKVRQSSTED